MIFWEPPDYVNEGETVWLPFAEKEGAPGMWRAYRCKVAVAAGRHARVVSGDKVDRWVPLDRLLVPPDDPRHPSQSSANRAAVLNAPVSETV